MPKNLQIGSTVFEYPEQGDKAGWGEEATEWATAVTEALQTVQGPNDIITTSATLINNQTTPANIPGLNFDVSEVQAIDIKYLVIRTFDAGASTVTEAGRILGSYNGTEFVISVETDGNDSGFDISVQNSGQFQYTTSDLTNHVSSIIRFEAKTIDLP
jgi:hypothetical protein